MLGKLLLFSILIAGVISQLWKSYELRRIANGVRKLADRSEAGR